MPPRKNKTMIVNVPCLKVFVDEEGRRRRPPIAGLGPLIATTVERLRFSLPIENDQATAYRSEPTLLNLQTFGDGKKAVAHLEEQLRSMLKIGEGRLERGAQYVDFPEDVDRQIRRLLGAVDAIVEWFEGASVGSAIQEIPAIPSHLLQRLEAAQSFAETPKPDVRLSATEQDLIAAISAIGPDEKRTQKAILDHLSRSGKIMSVGTTKSTLAAMKRHGILVEDAQGQYALPEWA